VVNGKDNIPAKGPLIVVANHPNTFMDPMIIVSITKQRLGFVGNGGIFVNKIVNSILTFFHVIPIYREKDRAPGEKQDNSKAFEKCHDYLNDKRSFLIFPEGNSYYELNLRKIKTGTARIALSFEALKNFNRGLKIVPIALDYSDALQFRSIVSVTVNPPMDIAVYKDIYEDNELAAIRQLTEDIRSELAQNVTQTSGKEQEAFLIRAHKFYSTYHEPSANLYKNPKRSLELRNNLSKALYFLKDSNPKLYATIENELHSYFTELKIEKLTPGFFTDKFIGQNTVMVFVNYFLKFIILLPVYILGLITHYLPYILPYRFFKSLRIDIEYKTPVQMVAGIITFPLFYALEIWLFRHFISQELYMTCLMLILLPVIGYLTMYYWLILRRFFRVVRYYFIIKPAKRQHLIHQRDALLKHLENAKSIYFNKR
jgi:1-acyl-sn-glycerol-3-phosphate acyltransferase